jgi:hypothetical protein
MDSIENSIQNALQDLDSGQVTSLRAAAMKWGVPRSTLSDRRRGLNNRHIANQPRQRLTPDQEKFLADWIIEQDHQGFPPTHARVREMALRVLQINGDSNPLGTRWTESFIRRNPRIRSCIGQKIESKRIKCTQPEHLREFFQRQEKIRSNYSLLPEDIWNMDEHGLQLGVCSNARVLAEEGKKHPYMQTPENREWATIIEAVNAAGEKVRPAVIFRGVYLQTTWFPPNLTADFCFTTSPNAWTSNEIAINWLTRIFIPETTRSPPRPRLLIMDGHRTHASLDFQIICFQNNILLNYLPPHTSHVLQPLDLSCFSPIKSKYRQLIHEVAFTDDATHVKKSQFIKIYEKVRQTSLTPTTIKAGWKAAGIEPYCPEKALSSSQIRIQTPKTISSPQQTTKIDSDSLLYTPRNQHDVIRRIHYLQHQRKIDRELSTVLTKAGKALGLASTREALQKTIISSQQSKLEAYGEKTKKKRIILDPNEQFARIEDIIKARDAAPTSPPPRPVKRQRKRVETNSNEGINPVMQSCMFSWNLNEES